MAMMIARYLSLREQRSGSLRASLLAIVFMSLAINLGAAGSLSAQNAGLRAKHQIALKGLTREQVIETLGEPDRRQESSGGRENWAYGRSLLFFQEGKVSAWSNAGDLTPRRNFATIREQKGSEYEEYSTSWENDWTPQPAVETEAVINEIMNEGTLDNVPDALDGGTGVEIAGELPNQSSRSKSRDASEPTSATVGSASNMVSRP